MLSTHETYGVFPEERDVRGRRVVPRVRDRPASGREHEVRPADEPGDEDPVAPAAGVLGPYDPRHGGRAGRVSVPAATRGSSASRPGSAFSEQASSARLRGRARAELVAGGGVERVDLARGAVADRLPVEAAVDARAVSATIFAANTCSLPRRPRALGPVSYQTVHATMSDLPVNAMSGSMPLRRGVDVQRGIAGRRRAAVACARRSAPTCCQQNEATVAAEEGLKPVHGAWGAACLTPLETKIWSRVCAGHLAVLLLPRHPGDRVVAGHGRAAGDRRVLGLAVGVDVQRRVPPPRSCPSGTQVPPPGRSRSGPRRSDWRRSA